jgi:hypothetical protein
MVNCKNFFESLVEEFPELECELQDESISGLYHNQMSCFAHMTQQAIDMGDPICLKKYFKFAEHYFRIADPDLKNAFYVSYLEHLDFSGVSKIGIQRESAKKLLPATLANGLKEINEYLDKLFLKIS